MIKTIINARIVNDLELKEVWEHKVLNFSVASRNKFKDKEWEYATTFIECTVWNKTAEIIVEHFNKWDWIVLEWDIVQQTWENDNWDKRSKHICQVAWFEFPLSKKWDTEATSESEEDDSF